MNIKEKSLAVQKGFASESVALIQRENLVENLNQSFIAFNENPEYGTFKAIKDAVDALDKNVKNTVKELLIENQLKSSEGPTGRFTLVVKPNLRYNDQDENADPRVKKVLELKKEIQSLEDEIKRDITLFKQEVPGVISVPTEYVTFRAAKNEVKDKAIAIDFVEGESTDEN